MKFIKMGMKKMSAFYFQGGGKASIRSRIKVNCRIRIRTGPIRIRIAAVNLPQAVTVYDPTLIMIWAGIDSGPNFSSIHSFERLKMVEDKKAETSV
jgi:hypothetical protein